MFNLFSYLWELETGKAYVITKANDIYSGLGAEAALKPDLKAAEEEACEQRQQDDVLAAVEAEVEGEEGAEKDRNPMPPPPPQASHVAKTAAELDAEAELASAIQRAETIVDSLEGVCVKVLRGTPSSVLYAHMPKYQGFFDAAFVGVRALGCVGQEAFPKLLKQRALLAVETGKYLVPLSKKSKTDLDDKILELVAVNNTHEGNGTFTRLSSPSDVVPRRRRSEAVTDVLFFQKQ